METKITEAAKKTLRQWQDWGVKFNFGQGHIGKLNFSFPADYYSLAAQALPGDLTEARLEHLTRCGVVVVDEAGGIVCFAGADHFSRLNIKAQPIPAKLLRQPVCAGKTTAAILNTVKESSKRTPPPESDPTGRSANMPGAKLDAGKNRVALVMKGFSRALKEVALVGTYGAEKYTPNGWQEVPKGIERYDDAMMRHWLEGKTIDEETGLLHAAQTAWNALAVLELMLVERERENAIAEKWFN